jgi:translation initiation factor 1 (eIF-1/SUI1)
MISDDLFNEIPNLSGVNNLFIPVTSDKIYIISYEYNSRGKKATIIYTENFYKIGKTITEICHDIKRICNCNGCIYDSALPMNLLDRISNNLLGEKKGEKEKEKEKKQYIQLQGNQIEKSRDYFVSNLGISLNDILYSF